MNEPPRGVPDDPGATRGGGNEDIKTSQGDGEGNERMQEQTIGGKPPSQQYEESEEACPRIDTEPRPEPNRRTSTSGQSAHDQTEDVPDVQARGNTIDETKGARKAVAKEKNQDEVPPQRKLELLLSSLNDSSPARPLTTELQLAAELYVAAVQRNHLEEEEKMEGLNKILNIKEKQRLLKLARVIGRTESRVAEAWDAALDKVLLLVAQAKWHLTKALDNVTSNLEVQCTPVLHEWIKVVKGSKDAATVVATPATTEEAKFMFNPAKYSEEDQQRLRALCLQQYDPAASKAECTEDEWRVAEGVAEGDILCRTLPPVLMKVLGAEGCFELQLMLHANIEGELKMQLDVEEVLHSTQRTTERVLQLIGTAAASRQSSSKDLYKMLASIKTVRYEAPTHTIVFTFFSRVAALRCGHVRVPFGRRLHTLQNTHISIDAVQEMKPIRTVQPYYHLRLRNLTRSMDLGRLYQWFKSKIPFEFEMVDLDTYSKHSRTSNTWELRFQIGHSPEYLRGKLRMIWFGEVIVLEHPRNKRNKQCLACGDLDHLARRCKQTPATLRLGEVVVIEETEVAALGKPKPAFKNLTELKTAIASKQEQKTFSVPDVETHTSSRSMNETAGHSTIPAGSTNTRQGPIEKLSERVRDDSWKTVTNSSAATVSRPQTQTRLQSGGQQWPSNQEVIDLLVSDEDGEDEHDENATTSLAKPSSTEHQQTSRAIHLLDSLTQTREVIATSVREQALCSGKSLAMQPRGLNAAKITTFSEVEHALGLRAMATPPTGNCQVLAVAQAVLGVKHSSHTDMVNALGKTIKLGVQQVASLNFGKEFPHEARARILLREALHDQEQGSGDRPARTSTGTKVTSRNSAKIFTKWLEVYATSPTDGVTVLPRHLWGNNDTLRMMASLLKRDIFVLGQDTHSNWSCTHHQCVVQTKNGASYQSAKEYPLDLKTWMQTLGRALTATEANPSAAPIVIRFLDEHHIAYSHFECTQKQTSQTANPSELDTEMKEVNSENINTEGEASENEGKAGGKCLDGTSISPDSALEIKILLSKDDAAKGNVIDFFKQVIPDMTEVEEERLRASDGFDGAELMGFMHHHQVSEASYHLWKVADQNNNTNRTEMQPLNKHPGAKISVAAMLTGTGVPVSNGDTHQMTVRARPKTGKGKRYHVQTPMKKKHVNGVVVNARNASVPLKKTRSEATEENEIPRRLLPEFAEAALSSESESGEQVDAITSQDNWHVLWDKKATEWTRRTKVRFPRTTDTERQWTAASIKEPLLLIQMMREFAFPARVLERSSAQQIAQWTSGWRVECLQEELHSVRNCLEQGPEKQWVSKWLKRLHDSATNQQRQLVADSSDDWNHATVLGQRYSRELDLCSPKHKSKLGRHLLSTLCYAIELKARSQLPVQKSQTVHQMLQLHLQHVDHDENLKAAFENADDYVDWDSVHTFFTAKALEIVHQTQLHN